MCLIILGLKYVTVYIVLLLGSTSVDVGLNVEESLQKLFLGPVNVVSVSSNLDAQGASL